MSRKRMTREDSRDQTTQRLLDAAQKLIAKKGLSAASVEDIAEAAGYTRGAFYSNFSSKGDLFIELLRPRPSENDRRVQRPAQRQPVAGRDSDRHARDLRTDLPRQRIVHELDRGAHAGRP